VLKKAGIVVATAAAGLLAVSPLAFAGDYEGDHDHHGHHHHGHHHENNGARCDQNNSVKHRARGRDGALISISRNTIQIPIQACNNSVIEGALGIIAKDVQNHDSHGG
jgi:ABC-type Zn2+ transport system substrate-binding protein/surface adhesin